MFPGVSIILVAEDDQLAITGAAKNSLISSRTPCVK